MAWPPALLFYGVPRLNSVVTQHLQLGYRHRRARWFPALGSKRDPFGMSGRLVVLEADDLLLLIVHEPPLTAGIGGIVLVPEGINEHENDLRRRPSAPWWR